MTCRLSVNVNKIALLRNSRGGGQPDVVAAARVAIAAGADGITVHPREDQRHITLDDVVALGAMEEIASGRIELNVEGDIREELLRLAEELPVAQFTVVPVIPGEVTSSRGWRAYDDHAALEALVARLKPKCRISVFCDASEASVGLAARAGADAVEFYTGAYAHAFGTPEGERLLEALGEAADFARAKGLRIHAGHDLDCTNMPPCLAKLKPAEVSIGHRLVSEALLGAGLADAVARYRACARGEA